MRQDNKVFILSLNGLAGKTSSPNSSGHSIPAHSFLKLRALLLFLRMLGYRQESVSEACSRENGRYYCPVIDIHNASSLAEFHALKGMFPRATIFVAPAFMSQFNLTERAGVWNGLRELTKEGLELGLAGYRYKNLTELKHTAQRTEISRSSKVIAERIGTKPKVAAFPAGTFDATTISCCRESGIKMGIGHRGLFDIADNAGHLAPRLSAARLTVKSLASILAFNYNRSEPSPAHERSDNAPTTKASTGA